MVVGFVCERLSIMICSFFNHEWFMRIISGSFLLGFIAGAYFHSIAMFSFLLLGILLIILFFEWPLLIQAAPFKYCLISFVYPIFPFFSLIYLNYRYHHDNIWLPLYPFLIAWAADTFGYLIGKLIGRNKICPIISPGKTWEGLIGSFCGIMLINLLVLPKITVVPFSYYADLWYLIGLVRGWWYFSIFCACQTVVAFIGGLFLSKLKRLRGVKDAGIILPGHGGFLDRFDSVLTTVLFVWLLIFSKHFLH